ncbi:MAG TPA: helix-turn-helix transcriptional regulator [Verrucomicrobiae bacterium]|nr:helix-turn-helix transcriptional regulator [Verrucomicrobiae bacterium]
MTKKASPRIDALLSKVKELTGGKGEKEQLADYLNVPPSRLSEWLAGKWQPGGEVALALSEWVRTKQVKQKSPGTRKRARAETRKRKSSYEKPKSGHR